MISKQEFSTVRQDDTLSCYESRLMFSAIYYVHKMCFKSSSPQAA